MSAPRSPQPPGLSRTCVVSVGDVTGELGGAGQVDDGERLDQGADGGVLHQLCGVLAVREGRAHCRRDGSQAGTQWRGEQADGPTGIEER